MNRYIIANIIFLITLISCEEVIDIDLNTSNPALVIEALMYKDSVCVVRLTRTTSYFSPEEPEVVEDANIRINDGQSQEVLTYLGNGYYTGDTLIGTTERLYEIEVLHQGTSYNSSSYMSEETEILSVNYSKDDSRTPFNPLGKTIFTVTSRFRDDPDVDNYYMVRFTEKDGGLVERYYLLTEYETNSGVVVIDEYNVIHFSETLFYEGGEVEVKIFSIDKGVYDYFLQLTDVLFWKRRVIPPASYNPESNFNNDVLGYFAAWSYDSEEIILE